MGAVLFKKLKLFTLSILILSSLAFLSAGTSLAAVSVYEFAERFGLLDCSAHGPCSGDLDYDEDVDGLDLAALTRMVNEGDVWHSPPLQHAGVNQNFDIAVFINTGGRNLGAFDIYLDFDTAKVTIDTTQGEDPDTDSGKGFHKGSDAGNYIILSNPNDIVNGHFRFAGISAGPHANGSSEHLIIIHAKTTDAFTSGVSTLTLRIINLVDELGQTIDKGAVTGASISFSP